MPDLRIVLQYIFQLLLSQQFVLTCHRALSVNTETVSNDCLVSPLFCDYRMTSLTC